MQPASLVGPGHEKEGALNCRQPRSGHQGSSNCRHSVHGSLVRSQSDSAPPRTSSTSSLISSPASFLTRDDTFPSECANCRRTVSSALGPLPRHLDGSNGLSLLTRSISLVFSQTSANFPKNSKCVSNCFLRL